MGAQARRTATRGHLQRPNERQRFDCSVRVHGESKKIYTFMSHHVYTTTQHRRHDFNELLCCAEGVEYKCTR